MTNEKQQTLKTSSEEIKKEQIQEVENFDKTVWGYHPGQVEQALLEWQERFLKAQQVYERRNEEYVDNLLMIKQENEELRRKVKQNEKLRAQQQDKEKNDVSEEAQADQIKATEQLEERCQKLTQTNAELEHDLKKAEQARVKVEQMHAEKIREAKKNAPINEALRQKLEQAEKTIKKLQICNDQIREKMREALSNEVDPSDYKQALQVCEQLEKNVEKLSEQLHTENGKKNTLIEQNRSMREKLARLEERLHTSKKRYDEQRWQNQNVLAELRAKAMAYSQHQQQKMQQIGAYTKKIAELAQTDSEDWQTEQTNRSVSESETKPKVEAEASS